MEVYLDILIIENLIMNYLIPTNFAFEIKTQHSRYLVGASIGMCIQS